MTASLGTKIEWLAEESLDLFLLEEFVSFFLIVFMDGNLKLVRNQVQNEEFSRKIELLFAQQSGLFWNVLLGIGLPSTDETYHNYSVSDNETRRNQWNQTRFCIPQSCTMVNSDSFSLGWDMDTPHQMQLISATDVLNLMICHKNVHFLVLGVALFHVNSCSTSL